MASATAARIVLAVKHTRDWASPLLIKTQVLAQPYGKIQNSSRTHRNCQVQSTCSLSQGADITAHHNIFSKFTVSCWNLVQFMLHLHFQAQPQQLWSTQLWLYAQTWKSQSFPITQGLYTLFLYWFFLQHSSYFLPQITNDSLKRDKPTPVPRILFWGGEGLQTHTQSRHHTSTCCKEQDKGSHYEDNKNLGLKES